MSQIIKNIYGVLDQWLIGSILLKYDDGKLKFRNENDTAYTNIKVANPVDDYDAMNKGSSINIPSIRHHMIADGISNISTKATKDGLLSEATMKDNGEIIGIAAYVEVARTGGTATFYPTINGVAQNISGQYCVIDGSNTRRVYQTISTPISYNAGQSVGIRCVTSSYAPNNTRAVITLFLRDR